MKNIIIGSGVVGKATGQFLESHAEEVIYYDTEFEVLQKLKKAGKETIDILPKEYDIAWICTPETVLFDVLPPPSQPINGVLKRFCNSTITVIRSTIPPSYVDKIDYNNVLHMPEFLREAVPLEGTFFPDRVIIGSKNMDSQITNVFKNFIGDMYNNIPQVVPMEVSCLVKLVSNAWLTTQIAFWNEIFYGIKLNQDPYRQIIANLVTQDQRISQYGSMMLGKSYSGKCLPKDLDHIINYTNSDFFKLIKKRNYKWMQSP